MKRFLLLLALTACTLSTEPDAKTPITPLPQWLPTAFDSLERCVGVRSKMPLSHMHFYVVADYFADASGDHTIPAKSYPNGDIVLSRYAAQFPRLWMHEMAHEMFVMPPGTHPVNIFTRCGIRQNADDDFGPIDPALTYLWHDGSSGG